MQLTPGHRMSCCSALLPKNKILHPCTHRQPAVSPHCDDPGRQRGWLSSGTKSTQTFYKFGPLLSLSGHTYRDLVTGCNMKPVIVLQCKSGHATLGPARCRCHGSQFLSVKPNSLQQPTGPYKMFANSPTPGFLPCCRQPGLMAVPWNTLDAPVLGPFHWLFPLPRIYFPWIPAWPTP